MRAKMGTVVPKKGTTVHVSADQAGYRKAIAAALRAELGQTHQAVKTAMRWTGASERTVKYWLSGERGPSGEHLIVLAQHSDAVLLTILAMAERLAEKRYRCAGCPERLLVLQNLGQEVSVSEDSQHR
jgi:hypothetical protein